MSIVVACSPHRHTIEGIQLAGLLAGSLGTPLVVAIVLEERWELRFAGRDRDQEDRQRRAEHAEATVRVELATLPPELEVRVDVRFSRSTSEGLIAAIRDHDADVIVLGSATEGELGQVSLGSVTQRLMHSSPVPVAVAPRGFTAAPGERVSRLSVAFAVVEGEESLVTGAGRKAAEMGARLRLVSFGVHQEPPATTGLGPRAEDPVLQAWAEEIAQHRSGLAQRVADLTDPPVLDEPAVGFGTSWTEAVQAVPWDRFELLVVGSSRTTSSWLVFLGDSASKIARSSPVPVILMPRRQR